MHQQYGSVSGKKMVKPIDLRHSDPPRYEEFSLPSVHGAQLDGSNAIDPIVAPSDNRWMIDKLRRLIHEMQRALQE